jgi:hypothetical protein
MKPYQYSPTLIFTFFALFITAAHLANPGEPKAESRIEAILRAVTRDLGNPSWEVLGANPPLILAGRHQQGGEMNRATIVLPSGDKRFGATFPAFIVFRGTSTEFRNKLFPISATLTVLELPQEPGLSIRLRGQIPLTEGLIVDLNEVLITIRQEGGKYLVSLPTESPLFHEGQAEILKMRVPRFNDYFFGVADILLGPCGIY